MKIVIPGSFDPFTIGHADLVNQVAKLPFEKITILVCQNADKKYVLTAAEKMNSIDDLMYMFPKHVNYTATDKLLVDWMHENGYHWIAKGIRDAKDAEYETRLAEINRVLWHDMGYGETFPIQTMLILANEKYKHVSSSYVKELAKYGKSLEKYVGASCDKLLKKRLRNG